MQGIRNSRGLCRSGFLGNIPPPLPAAAYFPHPQIGALPALGVPTPNLGVATVGGATAAPTPTDTVTPMPGKGARLTPNDSVRRSAEGPSILNIPPYASQEVRDDENPSLH